MTDVTSYCSEYFLMYVTIRKRKTVRKMYVPQTSNTVLSNVFQKNNIIKVWNITRVTIVGKMVSKELLDAGLP